MLVLPGTYNIVGGTPILSGGSSELIGTALFLNRLWVWKIPGLGVLLLGGGS